MALEKKTYDGTDEKAQQNAAINTANAKEVKNNITSLEVDLRNLVPILKKPMDTQTPPRWKNAEIQAIASTVDTKLNGGGIPPGLITALETKIGSAVPPLS